MEVSTLVKRNRDSLRAMEQEMLIMLKGFDKDAETETNDQDIHQEAAVNQTTLRDAGESPEYTPRPESETEKHLIDMRDATTQETSNTDERNEGSPYIPQN